MKKNWNWTPQQDEMLERLYPTTSNSELAEIIGKTPGAIMTRANKRGIHKTKEFLKSILPTVSRFKKGHTPYNKGKKIDEFMSQERLEKWKKTQYKKGNKPMNYLPIGTEVEVSGYIYVKVDDKPNVRRYDNWKLKHRLLWESVNGEIPTGYNIQFKDGNPKNITIENLYIISQKEQIKKNSYINLGPDGAKIVRAIAVLTKMIKTKERKNEQQTKRR